MRNNPIVCFIWTDFLITVAAALSAMCQLDISAHTARIWKICTFDQMPCAFGQFINWVAFDQMRTICPNVCMHLTDLHDQPIALHF